LCQRVWVMTSSEHGLLWSSSALFCASKCGWWPHHSMGLIWGSSALFCASKCGLWSGGYEAAQHYFVPASVGYELLTQQGVAKQLSSVLLFVSECDASQFVEQCFCWDLLGWGEWVGRGNAWHEELLKTVPFPAAKGEEALTCSQQGVQCATVEGYYYDYA
jgi:hypothetical protein